MKMINNLKVTGKSGEILGMAGILLFVLVIIGGGLYLNTKIQKNPEKLIPLEQLKTDFHDGKICFYEETTSSTNTCFNIAIENTLEERRLGLMNNKGITDDQGMLFIFEKEDFYGIWMKDTIIPLDVIWINSEGVVVFTAHDFQPCKEEFCPTITNDVKAQYVLEINAGLMSKKGIKPGSTVRISLLNK